MLTGFIDAVPDSFEDFDEVGILWIHEVCRTILDRYSDKEKR